MKIIKVILLLALATNVFAQQDNIKFKHLTVKDGLSHSWVRSVFRDSYGYMWFGTGNSGLNKYDGFNYTVYKHNPKDENSLSNNTIYVIHEDKSRNLWIGTQNGLNKYNRNTDLFIPVPSTSGLNINQIFSLDNGHLLLLTQGEVLLYKPEGDTYESLYNGGSTSIADFFTDGGILQYDSNKLLITTRSGLLSLDIKNFTFTEVTENETANQNVENLSFRSAFLDSKGRIWAGTENNGLFYLEYEPSANTLPVFKKNYTSEAGNPGSLSESGIVALQEDDNGLLWIGTANEGINALHLNDINKHKPVFYRFKNDPQNNYTISTNSINTLYKDQEGTVWIGTFNAGVSYYNKLLFKFEHFKHNPNNRNGLNSNYINTMYEDGNLVWVGTQQGLNILDRRNNTWQHFTHENDNPKSIGANAIWSIYRDSRNRMWIGSWAGGLSLYNEKTKTFKNFKTDESNKSGISSNNVFGITEDKEGVLWIATMGGGLNKFNYEENDFKSYTTDNNNDKSISTNWVKSIMESHYGELWIGTGYGIELFDKEKQEFTHFRHDANSPKSISSNAIVAIYEDSKKNIWVGTEYGLNLFNREKRNFTLYTEEDGLSNNIIRGICEDDHGNLWISTNKGISRFANAVNKPAKPEFKNYFEEDGLQGDEFSSRACFKGKDGNLYFGGSNGFNVFHPDSLSGNPVKPKVVLTNFLLFNKPLEIGASDSLLSRHISLTEEISLSYKQSVFRIEYAGLNFLASEKNQYAYMMEGFEEDWNYVGSQKFATYTNLDPGEYTFRVKASNNDGVWNEEGIALKILVTPPFWKTPWFIVSAIIFGVLLIIAFIKFRERGLRKDKQILEEKMKAGLEAVEKQKQELEQKDKQLQERTESEKAQNWFNHGMVRFNEILSTQKDDILKLSQDIITEFVKYPEADLGALYLLNDDDENDLHLILMATYAPDVNRSTDMRIEIGEGLVGACFKEKKVVKIDNLPSGYASITSGLGETPVKHLALIPLILNERIIGVIELLSLNPLPDYRIRFIEKAGETLTSILVSVRTGEKTRKILEEQKALAEELTAQEEELRQNLEEMQATQEEAARRAEELAKVSAEKEEKEKFYQERIEELEKTIASMKSST